MTEQRREERSGTGRTSAGKVKGEGYHIPPHPPLTAYDFRHDLQGWLGWSDDELRGLPVKYGLELPQSDEVYFDLDHLVEFRGQDGAQHPGCRAIPKSEVASALWLRLAASAGYEDRPAGNAAATPGAFGGASQEEIEAGG